MGGYTKNIAVIKGLKEGFSANGGELSGLVKVEKYGRSLKAEIIKINFAPLADGRYVTALSDGRVCVIFDGDIYEAESDIDTSAGFAALICFVNGNVQPVASAICGGFQGVALGLKAEVERSENIGRVDERESGGQKARKSSEKKSADDVIYEDEALAEVNYYEFGQNDEGGGVICATEEEEKDGGEPQKDETSAGAVEEACRLNTEGAGEEAGRLNTEGAGEEAGRLKLAGGVFYERMRKEIEGLLSAYPPEDELCRIVEGSKWVRISYDDEKYYVFGVIYAESRPRYLAYGVPAVDTERPPESMAGLASFIPGLHGGGWWITYQDADTGASLRIEAE